MKRTIISNLAHVVWIFISFFEKSYWLIWKIEQKRKFRSCGNKVDIGRYCHFTNNSIIIGDDVYIVRDVDFSQQMH